MDNAHFSPETAMLYAKFNKLRKSCKLAEWVRLNSSEISYETWASIFNGRLKAGKRMYLIPNLRTLLIMMHELQFEPYEMVAVLRGRDEHTIAAMIQRKDV